MYAYSRPLFTLCIQWIAICNPSKGLLEVQPSSFNITVAADSQESNYLYLKNPSEDKDLAITFTGVNYFWNGETEDLGDVETDEDSASPNCRRNTRNKAFNRRQLNKYTAEDHFWHNYYDEFAKDFTFVGHGAYSDDESEDFRLASIDELAHQIKAGRAIGVLARLKNSTDTKSLEGLQQAQSQESGQCDSLCELKNLSSRCKSSIYASEHLKMFSVSFEADTCSLDDIKFVLRIVTSNPEVDFMEVDGVVTSHSALVEQTVIPDDLYFSRQWGLDVLEMPKAWSVSTGLNLTKDDEDGTLFRPIVMVIDTGVDYNHPDLRDNMWINEAEYYGQPGVDDDNNGYVDDIYGVNTHSGTGDPMDDEGHGTHCAGIIGAGANNNFGVAGVHWAPKILACKFISKGSGTYANAIKCIDYALKMGVHIISGSWGGGPQSCILEEAIVRAGLKKILFVMSAGNAHKNLDNIPIYPASYRMTNTITVSAIDKAGLANYSNFGGGSCHLAAPGSDILSTTPNNTYSEYSGTSMAAPLVSGLSALSLSVNPTLTPPEIKRLIRHTLTKATYLGSTTRWGGYPNAFNLLIEAAGPSFFFPIGGWYPWRTTKSSLSPKAAARIPFIFTERKPGVYHGAIIVKEHASVDEDATVINTQEIPIEIRVEAVSQINAAILPTERGIILRAYDETPSSEIITIQQIWDKPKNVIVKISELSILQKGSGRLQLYPPNQHLITLQHNLDERRVSVLCSSTGSNSESKPTVAELFIEGPVGLNRTATKHRIRISCSGINILVPEELKLSNETDHFRLMVTKNAPVALKTIFDFDIDSNPKQPATCHVFKDYEIHFLESNLFIDLQRLYNTQESLDPYHDDSNKHGNLRVLSKLHGQDDQFMGVPLKWFRLKRWFNKNISSRDKIFVSTNGVMSFSRWTTHNDWSPAIDSYLPGEPQEAVAPFWSDIWSPLQYNDSQIYVYDSPERLIVQWSKFSQINVPGADFTFQTHILASGLIIMSYGKIKMEDRNPQKLNIGVRSGQEKFKVNVKEADFKKSIVFAWRSLETPRIYSKNSQYNGLIWSKNMEELEIVGDPRETGSAHCGNLSGSLNLLFYDDVSGSLLQRSLSTIPSKEP